MGAVTVPKTSIYLRDYFELVPGSEATFCSSATALVNYAPQDWRLIAAGSFDESYDLKKPPDVKDQPPQMMHIWRVAGWDTLYNSMYETSELGWYMSLEASIQRESQDFLVAYRAGSGVTRRPEWKADGTPGYLYRYDTLLLNKGANQFSFLTALVSFASVVKAKGWSWIWSASSVTGEQRVLSLLWCAPTIDDFEDALADQTIQCFYSKIQSYADRFESRYVFPIATETFLKAV